MSKQQRKAQPTETQTFKNDFMAGVETGGINTVPTNYDCEYGEDDGSGELAARQALNNFVWLFFIFLFSCCFLLRFLLLVTCCFE